MFGLTLALLTFACSPQGCCALYQAIASLNVRTKHGTKHVSILQYRDKSAAPEQALQLQRTTRIWSALPGTSDWLPSVFRQPMDPP